ncbi:MAG TPA: DeoR/GlpR family DNA-binding transcription regulator, partial [Enterococcus sp.]|nr:DeoR/GlpR family DNA-binding transcription regulator [Enterococcus sp.]
MLIPNRKERILELLAQKNAVSIQEFIKDLGVSESTLRRDLVALEEEGLLTRVHGGATTPTNLNKEQKMAQKESINQPAKIKIAKHVSTLVEKETQVYIDAGTTTLELVRLLPTEKNLKLVTNGIDHALL